MINDHAPVILCCCQRTACPALLRSLLRTAPPQRTSALFWMNRAGEKAEGHGSRQ